VNDTTPPDVSREEKREKKVKRAGITDIFKRKERECYMDDAIRRC
jgi:hypothetical protein